MSSRTAAWVAWSACGSSLVLILCGGLLGTLYGTSTQPYAVLSRLGQRLEGTLAPGAVLPAIVETVAQALKIPYAGISLKRDGGFETAAEYGTPSGEPLVLPLTYQNETVGRLTLSPRAKDEPFIPADRHLLEDLARQAGIAARLMDFFTTAHPAVPREAFPTLTEREREMLHLMAQGASNAEISRLLSLSVKTVANYVSNILHKLQVADRKGAVARAREAGLGRDTEIL